MKKTLFTTLITAGILLVGGATRAAVNSGFLKESESQNELVVKQLKPADGATVKTLSKVSLFFDISTLETGFVTCDGEKAGEIKLTAAGSAETVSAVSVEYDEDAGYVENAMPYTVTFAEPVTEAGEYTVTVPAGFFWTTEKVGEKPAGAVESKEITATFTVDPSAKGPFENYVVNRPAMAPTEIRSFDEVSVSFPELEQVFGEEAVLMKDNQPVDCNCYVGKDWSYGMNCLLISFEDNDGEPVTIKEAGSYELVIPAGSVASGGESNTSDIVLPFIVNPSAEAVYTWSAFPPSGSSIPMIEDDDDFIDITFVVDGASDIDLDTEWEDPESESGQIRSVDVYYDGEYIRKVANAYGDTEENCGWQLRSGWDGNDFSIRINRQVFTHPAELQIKIDRGTFLIDGVDPMPAVDYTLTVGDVKTDNYEVAVLPSTQTDVLHKVSDFSVITVMFPNAQSAKPRMYEDIDDDNNPVMVDDVNPVLKIGQLVYFGDYTVTEVADAGCPAFEISFPEINEYDNGLGGDVVFMLDRGAFILDGDQNSPEFSASWTLERTKEVDKSYLPTPQGDIVNNGYGIFAGFKFNDEEDVRFNGNADVWFNDEKLENAELKVQNWAVSLELVDDRFLDKTLTGKLHIVIPAGAVTVSGEPAEAIDYTWNVVLPKEFEYIFTPNFVKDGSDAEVPVATDLSQIMVEIPGAQSVRVWNDNYINLRSRDYFTYGAKAPKTEVTVSNGNPAVRMTFSEAPEVEAVYVLGFNYGALYIDNAFESPVMNYLVKFNKATGVELIPADGNGCYTVRTLDGKTVVLNGTYDDIKALDKGIYIVNGKKIAIH